MRLREKLVKAGLITLLAFSGCAPRRSQPVPEIERKPLPLQPINTLMVENKLTWEEVENAKITSIEDIFKYINKIKYVEDKTENWQSAKTTVERGEGDCEDIAILGAYLGEKLGCKPMLLGLDGFLYKENGIYMIAHTDTLLARENSNMKYAAFDKDRSIYWGDSIERVFHLLNFYSARDGIQFTGYAPMDLSKSKINWRTRGGNLFPAITREASEMFEETKKELNNN